MTYASASEYIEAFGAREALQLLSDDERRLTAEGLCAAIDNTLDPADGTPEAVAARAALKRLNDALVSATQFMDGYFRRVVALPLDARHLTLTPVLQCCVEITRCMLMDDPANSTEHAERRCEVWRKWLRDVAAGTITLDPAASGSRVITGKLGSEYDWTRYP